DRCAKARRCLARRSRPARLRALRPRPLRSPQNARCARTRRLRPKYGWGRRSPQARTLWRQVATRPKYAVAQIHALRVYREMQGWWRLAGEASFQANSQALQCLLQHFVVGLFIVTFLPDGPRFVLALH